MKPLNKYCAIYTRKSSEEGLEQDFNSLDAQRESCMAYIVSQKSEGWSAIKESYDDGGFSGGNMDRPALKRLLEDIQAGKVHTVVVYKIDRLTRSLMDFSKLVEVFDGHGVTFVSVTQSFNTTTSMGRLTLNVLLSFAQFEREVTGERIRDKIAASKKKGMWMGGMIPIGYDRVDKKLVVNPEDTATVRVIFEKYLSFGCVRRLKEYLDSNGYRSKVRITEKGRKWGGVKFSRGLLYKTLSNPIYIGSVRHKEKVYQGQHEGIVPQQLWDDVQKLLTEQSATKRGAVFVKPVGNLLKGILFDKEGCPYSPVFTKRNGKEYRYYVSQNLIQLRDHPQDTIARLPAHESEKIIKDAIRQEFSSPRKLGNLLHLDIDKYGPKLKQLAEQNVRPELFVSAAVNRIVLDSDKLIIKMNMIKLCQAIADIYKTNLPHVMETTIIEVPFQTGRSKHGTLLIEPDNKPTSDKGPIDLPPNEMKNLVRGLIWRDEHFAGMTLRQIAAREQITPRYISHLIERTFSLA